MKVLGVIPARWGSTRLEGKVLAAINGRPMIEHVWQRAKQSRRLDALVIACDHERVAEAAKGFGAEVIMTSPNHASGSDRIAEVASQRNEEIIVNIQGDEPLVRPEVIDALAECLIQDPSCPMATVIRKFPPDADVNNPNVVKVVVDAKGYALYFSRSPIPSGGSVHYKHLGLYAYRREFLKTISGLPPSPLEKGERLEQLRVLEAGYKIKTVLTEYDTVGVDTLEDLKRVEKILKEEAIRG